MSGFCDHQVGYVTLKLNSVGSPQDSLAFFRLKFGEIAKKMTENSADYDGWFWPELWMPGKAEKSWKG